MYGYGNGSYGCLFDNMSGPYEDMESAAEDAADSLDLTDSEREELAADGCLYFDTERAREVGAQIVEIFEIDEADLPDWESDR